MKILFDLRAAQRCKNRGIGNYINGLIQALLIENKSIIPFYLLTKRHDRIEEDYIHQGQYFYDDELEYVDLGEGFDYFFVGGFFDYASGFDRNVFVLLPPPIMAKAKMLTGIVYDFIPHIFKQHFLPDEWEYKLYELHMQAMANADILFPISEHTAHDAAKLLNISSNRLHVIYGGIQQSLYHPIVAEKCNHIVYVGADLHHKNINKAIEGFARAYRLGKIPKDARFLIICTIANLNRDRYEKLIKRYELTPGKEIELTGTLSEDKMLHYLRTAKGCIFPSLYEGLGLPILEGYAMNLPAYASNTSSLTEIVLPECSFDPTSIEEISQAFISLFNNDSRNARSIEFGKQLLKNMNWENAAIKVSQVLTDRLQTIKKMTKQKRIAVFSHLTSNHHDVANISIKSFSTMPDRFHCFSQIDHSEKLDYLKQFIHKSTGVESQYIFHVNSYAHASMFYQYDKNLFVLGNSSHHVFVLKEAIRFQHSASHNDLLLLNQDYSLLWKAYFNDDLQSLQNFYSIFYPFLSEAISNVKNHDEFNKLQIAGIYPILLLTGIKNVTVHQDAFKKIILDDVRGRIKDIVVSVTSFASENEVNHNLSEILGGA